MVIFLWFPKQPETWKLYTNLRISHDPYCSLLEMVDIVFSKWRLVLHYNCLDCKPFTGYEVIIFLVLCCIRLLLDDTRRPSFNVRTHIMRKFEQWSGGHSAQLTVLLQFVSYILWMITFIQHSRGSANASGDNYFGEHNTVHAF